MIMWKTYPVMLMPVTLNGYQRVGWLDSASALHGKNNLHERLRIGASPLVIYVPLSFHGVLASEVVQLHQRQKAHASEIRLGINACPAQYHDQPNPLLIYRSLRTLEADLAPFLRDAPSIATNAWLEVLP